MPSRQSRHFLDARSKVGSVLHLILGIFLVSSSDAPFLASAFTVTSCSSQLSIRHQRYSQLSLTTMCQGLSQVDEIYARMDKDGKAVQSIPTSTFLAATLLGIPLFAVVAPLSIVYQAGKLLLRPLRSRSSEATPIDSGIQVKPKDIIPRQDRKYDLVVLGGTGFTGRLAVRHLVKTYGVGKEVKWAIAGRSTAKLESVKQDLAKELGSDDVLSIDTLIVDTGKQETLPSLVKDTRAVVTTAGPFEQYGSPVVEFCAKYGTHYADITGETNWVRSMMLRWEETAQRTGAKIVSLCGHDSLPWDMTVMKLEEELPLDEELIEVECFDEAIGAASGGTIATVLGAVHGSAAGPPKNDFDVFLRLPDGRKSSALVTPKLPFTVSKANPVLPRFRNMFSTYFPLSGPNSEVVQRSAALRQRSKSFIYRETMVAPDFKSGFISLFGLTALAIALTNPITGQLLQEFVLPKPGEGPDMKRMENAYFLTVSGYGTGNKGTQVQSVMYFPRDAGYLDTARMLVESGLALALDEEELPSKEGGFFTPSTGMGQVLLDRICQTGTFFALRKTEHLRK